jgi:hypothetical protein
MEVALRRRLDGVAGIAISQARQTAEVEFAATPHTFSATAFREAVAEADVEVLRFELAVCGVVAEEAGRRWLAGGTDRFLLADGEWSPGQHVCVTGHLGDGSEPAPFVIEGARAIK